MAVVAGQAYQCAWADVYVSGVSDVCTVLMCIRSALTPHGILQHAEHDKLFSEDLGISHKLSPAALELLIDLVLQNMPSGDHRWH